MPQYKTKHTVYLAAVSPAALDSGLALRFSRLIAGSVGARGRIAGCMMSRRSSDTERELEALEARREAERD
jgi:hypothetical protein